MQHSKIKIINWRLFDGADENMKKACWLEYNSIPTETCPRKNSSSLLQHANNPVDWFPRGEEAWSKAHTENKPIFLSIGYDTINP